VSEALSEAEYEERALPELRALIDAFDALELDGLEAELASDILTLEFSDGARYVLNSHRAARQIWMAAERSAWHFDWDREKRAWIAHKTGDELWATLERVISEKLGKSVKLAQGEKP
jgi:iron-sulfur cluster assembly protein CyaY